ncbi:signal peptidase I [Candidatus Nomurabacteria bacterium CG1_02_43_90]|uniref:Signal peptidase I n=1 Tax=Candidatus Nomurabacteria bacterium CG1_02_43_90 TaxID=1805281 RepID=A0A1J4V6B4_9BACT|nr:MAG: signal peptidase I [Candidatus Nomurabacteria bacterium CG1_02_43_90]
MTEPTITESLKKHSFRQEAWETLRFILIALIIVVPIRLFIVQPFIVSGASMDPTFKNGQYLIVDELSYNLGNPARGDVAIFKYPKNTKQYFIKRVVGLPRETVHIDEQGKVSITDAEGKLITNLQEPYIKYPLGGYLERRLGADEYFMLGDNRAGSFDSRAWGPVPRNLIVGKPFLRLFPFTAINVLPGEFRQQQL